MANLGMGLYLLHLIGSGDPSNAPLRLIFSILYSINMYFQSYGAVSIVKVNAHWFHVRERGGFSGIFGTMISSGIFLAFTVNGWILDLAADIRPDEHMEWLVFITPAILLAMFFVIEFFMLRDSPSKAGHADFDTGDASSGEDSSAPYRVLDLFKRILTNPIIMTVAIIELCTGVLRNGVMHWFPIYAREVWVLPNELMLVNGNWEHWWIIAACFGVALVCGSPTCSSRAEGLPPRQASMLSWLLAALRWSSLWPVRATRCSGRATTPAWKRETASSSWQERRSRDGRMCEPPRCAGRRGAWTPCGTRTPVCARLPK
jgi:sugar phosphate permease